jgi:hypothetical protein
MAQQIQLGNSTIVLPSNTDDFHDGYSNGYLYYYDERHRPPFPLTSSHITAFIHTNMTDSRKSQSWNAGFITGWMEAFCENDARTLCSLLPSRSQAREGYTEPLQPRVPVLQEA